MVEDDVVVNIARTSNGLVEDSGIYRVPSFTVQIMENSSQS